MPADDITRLPWPGFWEGRQPPNPEGSTPALTIADKQWVYFPPWDVPFTVAALIINEQRQILAVSRKNNHNDLGLPGGKIDPEDGTKGMPSTSAKAIRREVREETGLIVQGVQPIFQAPCECYNMPLHCLTYYVPYWFGVPESREGAVTKWVDPSVVLFGRFGEYNAALFDHLRKSFPKTLGWLP